MKKTFLFLFLFISLHSKAQILFRGFLYDSASKTILTPVRIENLSTHDGTTTNNNGYFEINAKVDDYIIFSYVSYKNKVVKIEGNENGLIKNIYLTMKPIQLKDVIIKKGPTEYQNDSANRASIYQDAFEYNQQKSAFSPITSVYQKFSKKYKDLRKFQSQIVDMEKQKFIDTRYNSTLVSSLTKLNEEDAQKFMNAYPMEYDFARTASELEIKLWIKYYFQEYTKNVKK